MGRLFSIGNGGENCTASALSTPSGNVTMAASAWYNLSSVCTRTVAPPVQPDTVQLPVPATSDREVWHPSDGDRYAVRNVTRPTLTAFRPVGRPAPAAVIIAPGGAFLGLEMDKEGTTS